MSKIIRLLAFILFSASITTIPCRAADYLGIVKEAVTGIESGKYDAAASALEKAFTLDDCDPLGHTALGVVYLHTGRLDEADGQFRKALAVQPDDWRAHYALGVISLAQGHSVEAEEHFLSASVYPDGHREVSVLRLYINSLKGIHGASASPRLPLASEVAGIEAANAGRKEDAVRLFQAALTEPAPLGFEEDRSPLATFDPAHPISLPTGNLTWKPQSHKSKDIPVISGTISLRADASRTSGLAFVTFYVDGVWIGATNSAPYEFEWNTERSPNGIHEVKIEGKNEAGRVVSSKSLLVRLENASPFKTAPRSGPLVTELLDRLWNCVRVGESRARVHYDLAKSYLDLGERGKAIEHLEYTVAYQPDFKDARKLLVGLRGKAVGYPEIHRGRTGSKLIALTFDDGPGEQTPDLLAMLRRLDVRATFFVVGFKAEQNPSLVRAIQADGHEIENHTYSHTRLTTLNTAQVERELAKAAAVIRSITGGSPMYFRPPGGRADQHTKEAAAREGLTAVYWSVLNSAYEGARYQLLANNIISNASDGAIVLMHNGEPATTAALPKIVEALRSKGYKFATVSEIVGQSK